MTFFGAFTGIAALAAFAYAGYLWGYYKGYTAGMDYGHEKLGEYHEYTMKNYQRLSDDINSR